jgi:Type II CAAX prenyl endopeptidase Rce1-like
MIKHVLDFFAKYYTFSIILVLFIGKVCIFLLFGLVLSMFGGEISFSNHEVTTYLIWRKTFIPAIIETILGQYLILEYYQKINLSKKTAIILSTMLFALAHYQSFLYIVYEIPMGFLYAISYITFKERNQKAFWLVFLIHFMWNAFMIYT